MSSGSFKDINFKMCFEIKYFIDNYKNGLCFKYPIMVDMP